MYQHRDLAVRQNLVCLAAQHDGDNAFATMRGHEYQVTSLFFGCLDYRLIRMIVENVDTLVRDAGGAGGLPDRAERPKSRRAYRGNIQGGRRDRLSANKARPELLGGGGPSAFPGSHP